MQCYDVLFSNNKVGEAFISTEGLFKRIRCKCKLPDASVWRLLVRCGDKITDLGICIPTATFTVDKRVSGKLLDDDSLYFTIETSNIKNESTGCFVSEDEPFQNIRKLECARYLKENGIPMIYINPESKIENHRR